MTSPTPLQLRHTPGPWIIGAGHGLHGVRIDGDNGNRAVCGVIGVTQAAYEKDGGAKGAVDTADGWANARLIAKAPDFADLMGRMVRCADEEGEIPPALLDEARALLVAATGSPT